VHFVVRDMVQLYVLMNVKGPFSSMKGREFLD